MTVISNKCRVVTVVTGAGCALLLVSAATLTLTIQSDIGRDQLQWSQWSPHTSTIVQDNYCRLQLHCPLCSCVMYFYGRQYFLWIDAILEMIGRGESDPQCLKYNANYYQIYFKLHRKYLSDEAKNIKVPRPRCLRTAASPSPSRARAPSPRSPPRRRGATSRELPPRGGCWARQSSLNWARSVLKLKNS